MEVGIGHRVSPANGASIPYWARTGKLKSALVIPIFTQGLLQQRLPALSSVAAIRSRTTALMSSATDGVTFFACPQYVSTYSDNFGAFDTTAGAATVTPDCSSAAMMSVMV